MLKIFFTLCDSAKIRNCSEYKINNSEAYNILNRDGNHLSIRELSLLFGAPNSADATVMEQFISTIVKGMDYSYESYSMIHTSTFSIDNTQQKKI